ncbi:DUF397 domain-containing protein [Streptomyces sp. NPDC001594]|uniref:DUF397 domain-containing protein n=1 Tax=Streptomyces sp. NPDC001594 TaxID=3364590 RepID=UPI0036B4FB9E
MSEHVLPDASMLPDWRKSSYSGSNADSCLEVSDVWRKSSHSGNESGSCVEVLDSHPTAVPVRDSKNPTGPALLIPAPAWTAFVGALKREP